MVAWNAALLVRRLVLFIDHDHAKVFHRREDCGTSTDDHAGLTAAHALPHVQTLQVCHATVKNGDGPETVQEPSHGLWSQRDLWHEHDRAFAAGQRFFDDAQVDLGLA